MAAAFANSEMIYTGGKWDTFRMLTHPGTVIIPAALVAAEDGNATGREFVTAVAAGYRHYEWLSTTILIAVLGLVAGALWFVVEHRRVTRIDEQYTSQTPKPRHASALPAENRPVIP